MIIDSLFFSIFGKKIWCILSQTQLTSDCVNKSLAVFDYMYTFFLFECLSWHHNLLVFKVCTSWWAKRIGCLWPKHVYNVSLKQKEKKRRREREGERKEAKKWINNETMRKFKVWWDLSTGCFKPKGHFMMIIRLQLRIRENIV